MEDLVDYSRQQEFDQELSQAIHKDSTNIIIGCGGVGFWLGIFLAMNGHKNIVLVEGDCIDNTNLNRLPVPQTWVGINKAVALRKVIRSMRPLTRVSVVGSHITAETLDIISEFVRRGSIHDRSATVWDTTDDARIQRKISDFVTVLKNQCSVMYRKIGYEGWDIGAYENYDVWCDEENYNPGYRTSRANAITSALSAGIGYFARGLNMRDDITFNLKALMQQGGVTEPSESVALRQKLRTLKSLALDVMSEIDDEEYSENINYGDLEAFIDQLHDEGV